MVIIQNINTFKCYATYLKDAPKRSQATVGSNIQQPLPLKRLFGENQQCRGWNFLQAVLFSEYFQQQIECRFSHSTMVETIQFIQRGILMP